MVMRSITVLALGLLSTTIHCSEECQKSADCATQGVAQRAGRCPSEAYCSEGRCYPFCLMPCTVVRQDFNPCTDGLICSQRRNSDEVGFCRGRPILCQSGDDCPLYVPTPDQHWSCTLGVCRIPSFQYPYE
jgi:hypothetical protein